MKTKMFVLGMLGAIAITVVPLVGTAGGNGGNGIECTDTKDVTHQSPGVCVKAGRMFQGVGQAAQYFEENPDGLPPELLDDGKITAAELIRLNCTRPKDRRE